MDSEVLHYHVLNLNESSIEDDLKNGYRKLSLQYHPDKNKHPHNSADFGMINKSKQGLEDVLRHNDAMGRIQERDEDIQRQ